MADVDNFLEHYGVKGMKWGVVRSTPLRGTRTNKENKIRAVRKDARRRRQTLSDKNLDQLVKRLEQEKKLKSLLDADLSPGRTVAKNILGSAGGKIAGTVIAGAGVFAVKAALDGTFKNGNLAEIGKGLAGAIPKLKK